MESVPESAIATAGGAATRQSQIVNSVDAIQAAIERMPQYVPSLQTIGLPECGHWTPQERAAEVNQAMLEFLTAVGDWR